MKQYALIALVITLVVVVIGAPVAKAVEHAFTQLSNTVSDASHMRHSSN
jgi:Flp pilus assembly pilin Flp